MNTDTTSLHRLLPHANANENKNLETMSDKLMINRFKSAIVHPPSPQKETTPTLAFAPVVASSLNKAVGRIPDLIIPTAAGTALLAQLKVRALADPVYRVYAESLLDLAYPLGLIKPRDLLAIMTAILYRESSPPFSHLTKGDGIRGMMSHRKTNWVANSSQFLQTPFARSFGVKSIIKEAGSILGFSDVDIDTIITHYDDFAKPALQIIPMIGQTYNLLSGVARWARFDNNEGWIPKNERHGTWKHFSELAGTDLHDVTLGMGQIMNAAHIAGFKGLFLHDSPFPYPQRISMFRNDYTTLSKLGGADLVEGSVRKSPTLSMTRPSKSDGVSLFGDITESITSYGFRMPFLGMIKNVTYGRAAGDKLYVCRIPFTHISFSIQADYRIKEGSHPQGELLVPSDYKVVLDGFKVGSYPVSIDNAAISNLIRRSRIMTKRDEA